MATPQNTKRGSLPNGYRVDFRRLVDEGNPSRASDYMELLNMQKSTRVRDEFAEHAVALSLSRSLKPLHGTQGPKIRTREPRRIQLSSQETTPQAALPHTPCWSQREAADVVLEDVGDVGLNPVVIFHNTSTPELVEHALAHERDAHTTSFGALAVLSGAKTGLSIADRRVVRDSGTAPGLGAIYWGRGSPNVAMSAREFEINRERAVDYLNTLPRLYVIDGYLDARTARKEVEQEEGDADARPTSSASASVAKPAAGCIKVRIVSGRPSHALFARQFLLRPSGNEEEELAEFGAPDFTLYDAGDFPANRAASFASSSTLCTLSFQHREAVILGTQYLGELRDALMTYVDGRLLEQETLCLRGALNFVDEQENKGVTLILGLPGTGKSTLAANCPGRHLMAQDGIGWDSQGTFALSGGCYVKAAGLSPERERLVHAAAIGFGSILENVTFDGESRLADFDDTALTENIRAAFPLQALVDVTNRELCSSSACPSTTATTYWKTAGHPTDVILLCCDAYGVLPPVAKLTELQALYYFLSGYTTRVTQHPETGDPEVSPAFSPCFWASPLLAHPCRYAALLRDRLKEHASRLWILNTGWFGGGVASGGRRIPLEVSRAIIHAIQSGELGENHPDSNLVLPILGLSVPSPIPGVDDALLCPRELWADGGAYDAELRRLASLFVRNSARFADGGGYLSPEDMAEILEAGPQPYAR